MPLLQDYKYLADQAIDTLAQKERTITKMRDTISTLSVLARAFETIETIMQGVGRRTSQTNLEAATAYTSPNDATEFRAKFVEFHDFEVALREEYERKRAAKLATKPKTRQMGKPKK